MPKRHMQGSLRLLDMFHSGMSSISDPDSELGTDQMAVAVSCCRAVIESATSAEGCIAITLGNKVSDVVLLLAILAADRSCALLPSGAVASDAPAFCTTMAFGAKQPEGQPELVGIADGPEMPPGTVCLRSSGSTGKAKWVLHRSDNLLANAEMCRTRFCLSSSDRLLLPVPIHHMFGFAAALLPGLLARAHICLVPRGTPLDILKAERASDPTMAFLVPSQCRSLAKLRRGGRKYRATVVAGDRLAPDEAAAHEAMYGPILELYGSTECGSIAAQSAGADRMPQRYGLMPLMPGVEVRTDNQSTTPVPLCVRHPAGATGYIDDTGTVSEAQADWHTGDIGHLHPDGMLEVTGRADHSVKRDGMMVHFSQIEACLMSNALVRTAVVVAVGKTRRGSALVAFCAVQNVAEDLSKTLREHCKGNLPSRAVPDLVVVRSALPFLPSGKPDRTKLAQEAERIVDTPAQG